MATVDKFSEFESTFNFVFLILVNASRLHTYKGKTQSVSTGAALSMHALANDFGSLFDGSDHFNKRIADEVSQISQWEPANLYIVTDKAGGAKVFFNFIKAILWLDFANLKGCII